MRKLVMIGVVVLILVVAAVIFGQRFISAHPYLSQVVGRPAVVIDKSEDARRARAQLVQKLQDTGIVTKIQTNGKYVETYVMPAFLQLTFDQKETVGKVLYAQYYDADGGMVFFYDARDKKEIATYSPSPGLKLK